MMKKFSSDNLYPQPDSRFEFRNQQLKKFRFQRRISAAFLIVFSIFLGGSAIQGLVDGTYDELNTIWSSGAFWLGFVVQYHLD